MLIDVYSHSVQVSPRSQSELQLILGFIRRLIQWEVDVNEDGVAMYTAKRTYAYEDTHNRSVRFHKNLLIDFKDYLDGHSTESQRKVIEVRVHEFEITKHHRVKIKVRHLFEPRPDQVPVIEHLMDRKDPEILDFYGVKVPIEDNNKTITLRTGGGKTFITKRVMADLGLRTMVMMRGGYLERWIPDLDESFVLKGESLQIVQGSSSLSAVMQNAIDGLSDRTQIYLVSTDTFVEYLSHYERNGCTELYPIAPTDFYQMLGIGATVIDEGHQMPHRIMKFFSYLHVYRHTTLTATLDTMDKFMDEMLSIMYPKAERFSGPKVDPHIEVIGYQYQIANIKRVRHTGWKGSYNHTQFENSLMSKKNKDLFREYVEMCGDVIQSKFIKRNLDKSKCLIFFATIDMCTKMVREFEKRFPDRKVVRYVSKDKMSVMDDADIIVSTVLSAGTAVDIPNLTTSIMTTAIDSQQSNEQTVGRTRNLKNYPGEYPEFIYFICRNIPKHLDYHRNKLRFFKDKVRSHIHVHSEYNLGYERAAGRANQHSDEIKPMAAKPAANWWQKNQRWQKRRDRSNRRSRG